MIFSSTVFLFLYLPFVLIGSLLCKLSNRCANWFLLIMSLLFYAWGEPQNVFLMIFSIVVNYVLALVIMNKREKKYLVLAIIINVSVLFWFKYLDFCIDIVNSLFTLEISPVGVTLPIGISFYTFQALSYLVDVYRGEVTAEKNIINVGLYISFFPQLVAGPIVKYYDINKEIKTRNVCIDDMTYGIERFICGLSKKILLANNLAVIADKAFSLNAQGNLSTLFAWLGAVAYTLLIYYDFSGYSDMAIGLGRMFGFHFSENFDYPYMTKSVSDFWRRWHISLSSWFREYIYIPLGGNKKGNSITIRNTMIVWLLTGIWHGANFTFILWGIIYGTMIIIEKQIFEKYDIIRRKEYRVFVVLLIIICWVIFRAENVELALRFIGTMFSFNFDNVDIAILYAKEYFICILVGLILIRPIEKVQNIQIIQKCKWGGIYLMFALDVAYMIKGTYNPFIYFNF